MWQGRHHSAQKSTITGCALLAVSTSASKLPSVTAWILFAVPAWVLSAMLFVLNSLPLGRCFVSFVNSIRCCNRHLVSCRLPSASKSHRCFVHFRVLRSRPLPGKILCHSVQLDAPPDALVGAMMQSLPNRVHHRGSGIFRELETRSRAVLQIEGLDSIIQSTRRSHNRHRTILQAVDLIQPARLVARRH